MAPLTPSVARIVDAVAAVPGIEAVVLGGSRARGRADENSDWDIGLLFSEGAGFDPLALARSVTPHVDPGSTAPTGIGEWGPWIVGGAWLRRGETTVDVLYRPLQRLRQVIDECRAGTIQVHDQPGHPHAFVSAIWLGEIAVCEVLHDPQNVVGRLKSLVDPYPEPLAAALVRRFGWEATFSTQNARKAATRGDSTHVAGCAYRTLACIAQVIFATNRRYLINEKGAIGEAAAMPVTLAGLRQSEQSIWRAIGAGTLAEAFSELESLCHDVRRVAGLALK